NVLFVATLHDSVYAFDADNGTQYWQKSFLGPGITTAPCTKHGDPGCDRTIMKPEHGIIGTPVIDAVSKTLYVDAKTVESGTYRHKLHALDITTGSEKSGSPVIIQATAPGFPSVQFNAAEAFQRSGLLLSNGVVYVAFASNDSWVGWLLAYNSTTLAQTAVFCTAPAGSPGSLAGIWGGGAAPATDSGGNIYCTTGNGSFNANSGGSNYGMTLLKLSTPGLTVLDYF